MGAARIAPMALGDIPELARLERLCFSAPWSERSLAAELAKENAVFLVAREAGCLLGYVGMNRVLDEGYIDNLAVRPDCRRRGVARLLMTALLDRAALLELAFVTLEVRPGNVPARRLYASLGFEEAGRRKNFYRNPDEDGIIMTKYFMEGPCR